MRSRIIPLALLIVVGIGCERSEKCTIEMTTFDNQNIFHELGRASGVDNIAIRGECINKARTYFNESRYPDGNPSCTLAGRAVRQAIVKLEVMGEIVTETCTIRQTPPSPSTGSSTATGTGTSSTRSSNDDNEPKPPLGTCVLNAYYSGSSTPRIIDRAQEQMEITECEDHFDQSRIDEICNQEQSRQINDVQASWTPIRREQGVTASNFPRFVCRFANQPDKP